MNNPSVIVVGAGVGGLSAAIRLAARGIDVQIVERAAAIGGKLRAQTVADHPVDAGPTVFTMRWVFEELFAAAGAQLQDHLALTPATVLARHAWRDGRPFDLCADLETTVDAIGRFAGATEAQGYLDFCRRAQDIYRTLESTYLRAQRTNVAGLVWRGGLRGLPALARISPFARLWGALGQHFRDPRLRQLFGRYATYCGSSPFLAPATLMLVAHVEREGVWMVEGGMRRIADVLLALAQRHGVRLRLGTDVAEILCHQGRASGVRLRDGETLAADAVVFNGDVAALAGGLLGPAAARGLRGAARDWRQPRLRSLSAITWAAVARCEGFGLARHNVFFSDDSPAEFDELVRQDRLPADPTVYVCAQDRGNAERAPAGAGERLLCLVNAPARADRRPFTAQEIETCEHRAFQRLRQCGLALQPLAPMLRTTPEDFARLFPATGGALYGPASHGWQASFRRLGARHPLPGLYLAGGSTHPGPGVPMAALSGHRVAQCLWEDLASTRRWQPAPMPGGTSTP